MHIFSIRAVALLSLVAAALVGCGPSHVVPDPAMPGDSGGARAAIWKDIRQRFGPLAHSRDEESMELSVNDRGHWEGRGEAIDRYDKSHHFDVVVMPFQGSWQVILDRFDNESLPPGMKG